jgi:hypothetical protein
MSATASFNGKCSHNDHIILGTVSKNVSKGAEKILEWVVAVLSLIQSENWAFSGAKTRLRRPIPTLASNQCSHENQ